MLHRLYKYTESVRCISTLLKCSSHLNHGRGRWLHRHWKTHGLTQVGTWLHSTTSDDATNNFAADPTFDGIIRHLSSANPRANEISYSSLSTIDYRTQTHKGLGPSSIVDKSSISPPLHTPRNSLKLEARASTRSAQAIENIDQEGEGSRAAESNSEQGEFKGTKNVIQTRLRSLDSVENTLHNQQPHEAAMTTHRTALPSQQHLSGEETMNSPTSVADLEIDPDTLMSMHYLGQTLYKQQKYKAAENMHRKTLALRQRVLGEEHTDTLMSMNRLGQALYMQQRHEAAEEMHRKTLALRQHVLGEEHIDTLNSMHNLATTLYEQKQYKAAEDIYRKNLALQQRVLGKEHLNTVTNMSYLRNTLYNQQKYKAAEEIYYKTLTLQQRVLGEEHTNTLMSMNCLGNTLSAQQQYEAAEEIYRKTLALRQRVLGEEHADTLTSMNNLGIALSGQQQYKAAKEMHRKTLALRRRVLGEEHPDTLTTRSDLALVETLVPMPFSNKQLPMPPQDASLRSAGTQSMLSAVKRFWKSR